MIFSYYARTDAKKETICRAITLSRLQAAKYFAARKNLDLKSFLKIYAVRSSV
jgi:hypothetical protein